MATPNKKIKQPEPQPEQPEVEHIATEQTEPERPEVEHIATEQTEPERPEVEPVAPEQPEADDNTSRVKELFASHEAEEVHFTSDGTAFFNRDHARMHTENLEDKNIVTINRKDI